MPFSASSSISITPLQPSHAEAVFALHLKVRGRVPYGYLAIRDAVDFEALLADTTAACLGAWDGPRLVAYSLSAQQRGEPFIDSPLIRRLQEAGDKLFVGKGTVVDPEFQGRFLSIRLLKERMELVRELAGPHLAGLVAVSNLQSIVNLIRSGHWLVGLEHDGYCQNFVTYCGEYMQNMSTVGEIALPCDNLPDLEASFERGWIAGRIRKSETGRELVLGRLPALQNS
jgi:hypothetical protein